MKNLMALALALVMILGTVPSWAAETGVTNSTDSLTVESSQSVPKGEVLVDVMFEIISIDIVSDENVNGSITLVFDLTSSTPVKISGQILNGAFHVEIPLSSVNDSREFQIYYNELQITDRSVLVSGIMGPTEVWFGEKPQTEDTQVSEEVEPYSE